MFSFIPRWSPPTDETEYQRQSAALAIARAKRLLTQIFSGITEAGFLLALITSLFSTFGIQFEYAATLAIAITVSFERTNGLLVPMGCYTVLYNKDMYIRTLVGIMILALSSVSIYISWNGRAIGPETVSALQPVEHRTTLAAINERDRATAQAMSTYTADSLSTIQTFEQQIAAIRRAAKSKCGIHYTNIANYKRKANEEGKPYPTAIGKENKAVRTIKAKRDADVAQLKSEQAQHLMELAERRSSKLHQLDTTYSSAVAAVDIFNTNADSKRQNMIDGFAGFTGKAAVVLIIMFLLSSFAEARARHKAGQSPMIRNVKRKYSSSGASTLFDAFSQRFGYWMKKAANAIKPDALNLPGKPQAQFNDDDLVYNPPIKMDHRRQQIVVDTDLAALLKALGIPNARIEELAQIGFFSDSHGSPDTNKQQKGFQDVGSPGNDPISGLPPNGPPIGPQNRTTKTDTNGITNFQDLRTTKRNHDTQASRTTKEVRQIGFGSNQSKIVERKIVHTDKEKNDHYYTKSQVLKFIDRYDRKLKDFKKRKKRTQRTLNAIQNNDQWLTYWRGRLTEFDTKQG